VCHSQNSAANKLVPVSTSVHRDLAEEDDEITVYTVRAAWEAALAGQAAEWCVDFNTIVTDLDFRFTNRVFADNNAATTRSTNRFSLQGTGPSDGNALLNKIDASPFETTAPDGNLSGGTSYARIYVEGDSNVMVTMNFDRFGDGRVVAWGGTFTGTKTNEQLNIELVLESGQVVVVAAAGAPNSSSNGFFGFTLKTETLQAIRFKAKTPDGQLGGETFGLDDVCGTSKRPSRRSSSAPRRRKKEGPVDGLRPDHRGRRLRYSL
jgi:hypothetical protein